MSAYRSPGRLTPAAQRLDLLQLRADRRRGASALLTPGIGDSGWHWIDLKAPLPASIGAGVGVSSAATGDSSGNAAGARLWQT